MSTTSNLIALLGGAMITGLLSGAAAAQQAPAAAPPAPAPPAPAAPSASSNVENGKALFMSNGCAQCHGNEGQGAPTSGPRVAPNPLPVPAFTRYLRSPRNQMPPYSEKVASDQDVRDIHAYLVLRAKPAVTPLLQPEQ